MITFAPKRGEYYPIEDIFDVMIALHSDGEQASIHISPSNDESDESDETITFVIDTNSEQLAELKSYVLKHQPVKIT